MIYEASDFPTEGQNLNSSEPLPGIDFLIRNINKISTNTGREQRRAVPNFGQLNINAEQMNQINNGMTERNIIPDNPNLPNEPQSKNMVISKNSTNNAVNLPFVYGTDFGINAQSSTSNQKTGSVTFFRDVEGRQYKTVGEKLYVLGWQDSDVKIRLVSEKTNKEIPTTGKKFQIYGWHVVNKIVNSEELDKVSKIDDVESKLSSAVCNHSTKEQNNSEEAVDGTTKKDDTTTETKVESNPQKPDIKRLI